MRFLRSPFGSLLIVLLLGSLVAVGATTVQVRRVTSPPRHANPPIDFEAMKIRVEDVTFPAADGVRLRGSLLRGDPGLPPLVLCHDYGSSRSALSHLAIALRKNGFTVLAFDFRGHGDSEGKFSSRGVREKRDILGAVQFLSEQPGIDARRMGIYGVGMGAHAAVLAAFDRPVLRVLVLDGLYPDASYALVRDVFAGWSFGVQRLGFLPRAVYAVLHQESVDEQRAAEVLQKLLGRDLLLLAPAGDGSLTAEMQRMYSAIPQQPDLEGNLVILPATESVGLEGDELARYYERVAQFFTSRLAQRPVS
ncbi:MAG TPA: alpha/beta fold hydrolase [Candidatus Polarisedimenticolaceae bacterium]|nr:alpha/beta fold hydrolase [Candidatus Polarisedimenticolaceae bacterium]